MTERALPAVGVGVRSRPYAGGHTNPLVRPKAGAVAGPVVAKREAVLSTPVRAGMLFGATAAVYAVTLAGISGLQAESDAAVAAARAPYLQDVAAARAANDAFEARITEADAGVRSLVTTYASMGEGISAFQGQLDTLAALVADVEGSAAALPARIQLPSVTTVRISRSSSSSSGSGGATRSAPSTGGSSGASGG